MNESKASLASHSQVVRGPNGLPLLVCPSDWLGPIVQRFVIPSASECGPQSTGMPVLFVSRSGMGKRWYRSGIYERELRTGPFMMDTYGASYERDHARWEGVAGESVGIRFPASVTQRLMHDGATRFDLATRYEIADERMARNVFELADEIQSGFPNGRMYAEGLSLALVGWLSGHYLL